MRLSLLILSAATLALTACSQAEDAAKKTGEKIGEAAETAMTDVKAMTADKAKLAAVLAAQPDATKARYDARHPAETLEFFGIAPGMAVGEALPGGGWYTKILLPYLGDEGRLVGVDYPLDLWPNFNFGTEEFIEGKKSWPETWTADARGWTSADIDISAYTFSDLPQDGSLDAFLFIRALHNLNRFEEGRFMTDAVAAVHGALKPGGIVGVVQHEAPVGSDVVKDGNAGYLARADVIAAFEAGGFELVDSSDINANPKDMPGADDIVWRLPPSLATSREDEALKAKMQAIGETNRMTLKFRKI